MSLSCRAINSSLIYLQSLHFTTTLESGRIHDLFIPVFSYFPLIVIYIFLLLRIICYLISTFYLKLFLFVFNLYLYNLNVVFRFNNWSYSISKFLICVDLINYYSINTSTHLVKTKWAFHSSSQKYKNSTITQIMLP